MTLVKDRFMKLEINKKLSVMLMIVAVLSIPFFNNAFMLFFCLSIIALISDKIYYVFRHLFSGILYITISIAIILISIFLFMLVMVYFFT